jgi:hypothetical protein
MSRIDTSRDWEQTRRFLIKTAQAKLKGKGMRMNMVDELVAGIMKGGSFIDAVNSLVDDCYYWDQ